MIKRPTSITAGDIAGAYSVAKFLKFGGMVTGKLIPGSVPTAILATFLLSKRKVNGLFSDGGDISGNQSNYVWDDHHEILMSKIDYIKLTEKTIKERCPFKDRVRKVIYTIKEFALIILEYAKFCFTVQKKNGATLKEDLIVTASIALSVAAILSSVPYFTTLFGVVMVEILVLYILVMVIEPVTALFERENG